MRDTFGRLHSQPCKASNMHGVLVLFCFSCCFSQSSAVRCSPVRHLVSVASIKFCILAVLSGKVVAMPSCKLPGVCVCVQTCWFSNISPLLVVLCPQPSNRVKGICFDGHAPPEPFDSVTPGASWGCWSGARTEPFPGPMRLEAGHWFFHLTSGRNESVNLREPSKWLDKSTFPLAKGAYLPECLFSGVSKGVLVGVCWNCVSFLELGSREDNGQPPKFRIP